MMKFILLLLLISLNLLNITLDGDSDWPVLKGPYLGQKLPGMTPEFFAPGIVTTRFHEHSAPAISPDGNWIFWSAFLAPLQSSAPQVILFSKKVKGQWTPPEVASFSGRYMEGGLCFSSDGQKLFFSSRRPLTGNGEPKDWDIWFVRMENGGWSRPVNLGSPVNSDKDEAQPSVTKDGTIYFISKTKGYKHNLCIARSKFFNGRYLAPEVLPEPINLRGSYAWCPFIASDESYLLFSSERKDDLGLGDIYISHKRTDDSWSEPINLGRPISTKHQDRFPGLSPDGKVLFFTSKRSSFGAYYKEPQSLDSLKNRYSKPGNGLEDIYWVDAKIIDKFRPKNINEGG
jgi:Tol biopolymer transport system component